MQPAVIYFFFFLSLSYTLAAHRQTMRHLLHLQGRQTELTVKTVFPYDIISLYTKSVSMGYIVHAVVEVVSEKQLGVAQHGTLHSETGGCHGTLHDALVAGSECSTCQPYHMYHWIMGKTKLKLIWLIKHTNKAAASCMIRRSPQFNFYSSVKTKSKSI